MPLFRHNVTGNEFTASDDYVSALPEGAVTKIADESPQEEHDRLQQEALENKVELVFDGDPDATVVDPDTGLPVEATDDDTDDAPAKPARGRAAAKKE